MKTVTPFIPRIPRNIVHMTTPFLIGGRSAYITMAQTNITAFPMQRYTPNTYTTPQAIFHLQRSGIKTDSVIIYDSALSNQKRSMTFSPETSLTPRPFINRLVRFNRSETSRSTTQALIYASLEKTASALIISPVDWEVPTDIFASLEPPKLERETAIIAPILEGLFEYLGTANNNSSETIDHIVIALGKKVYNLWTQTNGSLEDWFRSSGIEGNYPNLKLASPSASKEISTPAESDTQKALKNLDAFLANNGSGRNVMMVHRFGRNEQEKAIMAGIEAVEKRLSTADLQYLWYMITFLADHIYQSSSLTLKVLSGEPFYTDKLPDQIKDRLSRLNIPFMERLQELMQSEEIKNYQSDNVRYRSYIFDNKHIDLETWRQEVHNTLSYIFENIHIDWHTRRWVENKFPDKSAYDRKMIMLERSLKKLKKEYSKEAISPSAPEETPPPSTPTESDIQKVLENLNAFVKVRGGGRNHMMVHRTLKNEEEKTFLAAIEAIKIRLPQAGLENMMHMTAFLAGHDYRGVGRAGYTILQGKRLDELPDEIATLVVKLNIPFMTRVLELMQNKEIREAQSARIPHDLGNPFSILWADESDMPTFAKLFIMLRTSMDIWKKVQSEYPEQPAETRKHFWQRAKSKQPENTASDKMIITLERSLAELKKEYPEK